MSKGKQYESNHELHLYCRYFTTDDDNHQIEYPEVFDGKNLKNCLKEARKDGWKINQKKKTSLCPKCVERSLEMKKKKGLS